MNALQAAARVAAALQILAWRIVHPGTPYYGDDTVVTCEGCNSATVDMVAGVATRFIVGPGVDFTAWCTACWRARTVTPQTAIYWLPPYLRQGTWGDLDALIDQETPECLWCRGQCGPVVAAVHSPGDPEVDLACHACLTRQQGIVGDHAPEWWADFGGPVYTAADEIEAMDQVRAGTIQKRWVAA